MTWYPAANNSSIGIVPMFNQINAGLEAATPGLGGNALAIAFLLPLWAIIFLPLARFNPLGAFTVASFVCWLISAFFLMINWTNELVFTLFAVMWVVGAITYYLQTRG